MSRNVLGLNNSFLKSAGAKAAGISAALLLLGACASDKGTDTAAVDTGASAQPSGKESGPVPGSLEDWSMNVPDRVFFAVDKSSLDQADRKALQRQVAWLKQYPQVMVTVEGHCDERGTREYNLALGARRANSVKNYLVSQGVDPSRVTTISYGKERPVDPRSTEAAWRVNRRGVTVPRNPVGGS
ncbi:MAG: peptidoglycan-associated lipoprotein Pal [Alphaproteobacteria bacterium]